MTILLSSLVYQDIRISLRVRVVNRSVEIKVQSPILKKSFLSFFIFCKNTDRVLKTEEMLRSEETRLNHIACLCTCSVSGIYSLVFLCHILKRKLVWKKFVLLVDIC